MPTPPANPSRFPAACLAVLAVCGAGFSVLQAELAAHAALEPEWVGTCTRAGMGGFLAGTWLSILLPRPKALHALLSAVLVAGLALGITGGSLPVTTGIFAVAVGFAEVCLSRELVQRRGGSVTADLMLSHAGWPVGFLLGTLLTAGFPADSLSLRLAFLLVNAVGALWMLRRTLPTPDAGASRPEPEGSPRLAFPWLLPLALVVGGIEFAAEARLLASTPSGWEPEAFALLTILLAATRVGLSRWWRDRPGMISPLLGTGIVACLLAVLALPSPAPPLAFLGALTVFALGKAALWPGMLALAAPRDPRHVRFIIPALVTLGVLAPGLLALLRG